MRIPRVYQEGNFSVGETLPLTEVAFHHCIKVLRLTINNNVIIFDGNGNHYFAKIITCSKKDCLIELLTQHKTEKPKLNLTLIQSIIKPDKMDLILQKCVELGVTSIIPCISSYSDIQKMDAAAKIKKQSHWQKILITACEQCGMDYLPNLHSIVPFSNCLIKQTSSLGIILDPRAENYFNDLPAITDAITVLIGPEGGFSTNEIELAKSYGFHSIKLGKRILRAETAAISIVTLCQWRYGEF